MYPKHTFTGAKPRLLACKYRAYWGKPQWRGWLDNHELLDATQEIMENCCIHWQQTINYDTMEKKYYAKLCLGVVQMKYYTPLVVFVLLFILIQVVPVYAGEPTGEIGVMNPTMFKCVRKDNTRVDLVQEDPWLKVLTKKISFQLGGQEYSLEGIQEILSEYPDAQEETCVNELDVDYGFNPYDSEEFNGYLRHLDRQCKKEDPEAHIVPITDTRVEGYVYEYHPKDPSNPAESEWFGVPSRDVMVRARGITFEIFWGSGEEGYYYFHDLGAGPIIVDLRLPPDAHAINPDVVVFSNGLKETWTVFMGFYRGDVGPSNPAQLETPGGNFLPFITLGDIANLSKCGSTDLPAVLGEVLPPPQTIGANVAGMPDVGGVLPDSPKTNIAVFALAAIILIALPTAGFLKMRAVRSKDSN